MSGGAGKRGAFDDPLHGGDFHDFHPSENGNQLLRDAGMWPNASSVRVQQPEQGFQVPAGFDDTGFVMESQ